MSFDWFQFLAVANQLAGRSTHSVDEEARLRSSVSRAYYAAFCESRNFALTNGGQLTGKGVDHGLVPKFFRGRSSPSAKAVAVNLDRLRANRNKCDYDNRVPNLLEKASQSLKLSNDVFTKLPSA